MAEARAAGTSELFAPPRSRLRDAWGAIKWFARHKPIGFAGAIIVLVLTYLALLPQTVAPYDPRELAGERFENPSGDFILGTDDLGRDVFSRSIWAARVSMRVGTISVFIGITFGVMLGLVAAYIGGAVDLAAQRVVDAWMAFPGLILALFWVSLLEPGINTITFAIAITLWPSSSRVIRSSVLAIKETTYIEAARAIGCSTYRILFRHIFPNIIALYVVLISLAVGGAIIVEASLTFLGLGIEPDIATWGNMVFLGTRSLFLVGWWLPVIPSVCIALTVYGFNMLGDGLRDVWDPRLRGSQ